MVEVIHYETANKNKTIGYADIRVPILKPTVIVFRNIAHIQSGDRRWFNLPSFSRGVKPDGSTNYLRFAELETQTYNNQLVESLHERVKEYCARHGIQEVEPMDFSSFPADIPTSMDELPF